MRLMAMISPGPTAKDVDLHTKVIGESVRKILGWVRRCRSMREDAFDRIDDFVQREMRDRCIPGLAVAITDKRQTVRTATYGLSDLRAHHPVTPVHRFQIGSISKSFASIALLQLQQEGKLRIDDLVTEHLPWFKVRTRHGPIKLRHLMSHTAGIVNGTDSSPSAFSEVFALKDLETGSAPGSYFHYSNSGYKALGLVLEEVTGRSNVQVLMDRVIRPLGMHSTEAEITNHNRDLQPTGHNFQHDDRPSQSCPKLVPSTWFESNTADGSIISTPSDMATYVRMLLNRGAGDGARILSSRSFNLLTSREIKPQDARSGEYYGLGLDIGKAEGHMMIGHTGGMVGFVSEILADMDGGLGTVVLNNSRVDSSGMVRYILRVMRAERAGKRLPPLPKPYNPTVVRGARAYAGKYRSGDKRVSVEAQGRSLVLRTEADEVTLEVRGKDRFFAAHPRFDAYEIRFGRKGRKVVEMFSGPDWYANRSYTGPRRFSRPEEWDSFVGQYRAHNPWTPSFRIFLRKGSLVLAGTQGEEQPLVPLEDGSFRVGADRRSPERVRFDAFLRGKATRAVLSGAEWHRTAAVVP